MWQEFLNRVGTFLMLIGVGILVLFVASAGAGPANFDYLFWSLLACIVGFFLRRRSPPTPPFGALQDAQGTEAAAARSQGAMMASPKLMSLAQAVSTFVKDDHTLYAAGFTHLIPFAAGHEIIRQGRKNLVLARATPDLIYDQMVAAGCARKVALLLHGQSRGWLAAARAFCHRAGSDRVGGVFTFRHDHPPAGRGSRVAIPANEADRRDGSGEGESKHPAGLTTHMAARISSPYRH